MVKGQAIEGKMGGMEPEAESGASGGPKVAGMGGDGRQGGKYQEGQAQGRQLWWRQAEGDKVWEKKVTEVKLLAPTPLPAPSTTPHSSGRG